jgi:valyl-tRNA synthetase
MLAPYPKSQPEKIDAAAEKEVALAKEVVNTARNLRSEAKVPPKDRVAFYVTGQLAPVTQVALVTLARISELKIVADLPASDSPFASAGPHRLMPHIEVDPVAEKARLQKEASRFETEIAKSKSKLANASFVDRAPPDVVGQERARLAEFEAKLAKLREQQKKLSG